MSATALVQPVPPPGLPQLPRSPPLPTCHPPALHPGTRRTRRPTSPEEVPDMATLNRVELIGRLTRDPEMRYTPSGVPVANLSLAVNSAFTRDGQRPERADFFDIAAWQP